LRLLLVFVVLFIVYGTLYPFEFDFHRTVGNPVWILFHSWPKGLDRFTIGDSVTNLLLYMPLGFCAALAFGRRWWAAILLGASLSASVEMLQIYDVTRTCSLSDLTFNTLGTALGAAAALLAPPRLLRRTFDRTKSGPLLIASCWAGYLLYPFVPLFTRLHLHNTWIRYTRAPIGPAELIACTAEWFAAALATEAVAGKLPNKLLGLALLAMPLRLVLADRYLTQSEVAGGLLALLLWAKVPKQHRAVLGGVLMAVGILLRELAPFNFVADPQPFSWIPFAGIIEESHGSAAVIALRQAFNYGAMVWMARGFGIVRAGTILAAVLMVTELIQRYLPGRQPEITDAVLALMMTGILAWSRRR
jgi:VanZ family protein